jgi:hypothetical protein
VHIGEHVLDTVAAHLHPVKPTHALCQPMPHLISQASALAQVRLFLTQMSAKVLLTEGTPVQAPYPE